MRIGERDVDRLQADRVIHLPPVGRDHVGRGRNAGRAAELGHHLASRIPGFRAARVFRIREQAALPAAQRDRFIERPRAVRVERHTRIGKARLDRGNRLHLVGACHHAALQLEIGEAVALDCRLCLPRDRGRRERRFVAQPEPRGRRVRFVAIRRIRAATVADVEQVREHRHRVALLAFAEQRRNGDVEALAEQVEQCGLDRGDHVVQPQVDLVRLPQHGGLAGRRHLVPDRAAGRRARRAAAGQRGAHRVERRLVAPDRLADHETGHALERLADPFAARHFADAGPPAAVGENHEVAGEERRMRAAQVQQHAVAPGDRDHLHAGHQRGVRRRAGVAGFGHCFAPGLDRCRF
ncbi:hypothetical protein WK81_05920 [Burkholderia ubonensis]|nr:hypothetical protein WK81_05920 [Burkholderia ubonensis]